MAKTKQQIANYIVGMLIASIFTNCANQMSPPGGDVDELPPTILSTYPENKTVNFGENEIEFTFSEYVNKRNINEAFFISPIIEGSPEFSWTNKTVYIEFQDTLRSNTTYSVIIGTQITDVNNNNNMSQPYILTFSTGSIIDSGKISGKVFAEKSEGTLIFAYKNRDEWIDIYNQKPSYLSQINKKGTYEINGLGNGRYTIFAVKDKFQDLTYDIGSDLIGLPFMNVNITDSAKNISGMDFLLQKEDTLSPNMQNVTMTDRNHIVIEFDEPVDSMKISTNNFTIIDSTLDRKYPINYWFQTNSKKNEYILAFSDSLISDNDLFLTVKNIYDKYGNISVNQIFSFSVSDKSDTNIIKLGRIETPYENEKIDYLSPSFILNFNDGFDSSVINRAVKLMTSDSTNIPLIINGLNNSRYSVKSLINIKPKSKYRLQIDMSYLVDIAGNKIDTLISKNLTTVNDLDFSGASGKVLSHFKDVQVVLKNIGKGGKKIQIDLDSDKSFNFSRVIPGKYLIWAYNDRDTNNIYGFGQIKPFEYAEYFYFYPDTLDLRARWPIGDILIDFKQN